MSSFEDVPRITAQGRGHARTRTGRPPENRDTWNKNAQEGPLSAYIPGFITL